MNAVGKPQFIPDFSKQTTAHPLPQNDIKQVKGKALGVEERQPG